MKFLIFFWVFFWSILGPQLPSVSAAPIDWRLSFLQQESLPPEHDGHGVVVAVLDTGMRETPSLKGRIWKDLEGHKGFDFIDNSRGVTGDGGALGDGIPHGTMVSELIAGRGGRGAQREFGAFLEESSEWQIPGMAPGAKLMPLVVSRGLENKVIGWVRNKFVYNLVRAIRYAVDHGAHVINISYQLYENSSYYGVNVENIQLLESALIYARDHGVIVVAISGNAGFNLDDLTPGSRHIFSLFHQLWNVVIVGANNERGEILSQADVDRMHLLFNAGACFGAQRVHVTAPGRYTSFAAPLVSGLLARALSVGMSPSKAVETLYSTAIPLRGTAKVKYGVINPKGMLDAAIQGQNFMGVHR